MKKLLITIIFLIPFVASARILQCEELTGLEVMGALTRAYPEEGGTGSITIPTDGMLLQGSDSGTYEPVPFTASGGITLATSSTAIALSLSGASLTWGQSWEIDVNGFLAPTTTQNIMQSGTLDVVGLTSLSQLTATSTSATSTIIMGEISSLTVPISLEMDNFRATSTIATSTILGALDIDLFATSTWLGQGGGLIFGFGEETINEIWEDTLNKGVLDAVTVTDEGGLNISWTAGEVFDQTNATIIDTDASGSTGVTNDAVNYLISDSSATLTLTTTFPISTEVLVAVINAGDGEIFEITKFPVYSTSLSDLIQSQQELSATAVASGMIISEESGGVAFDVALSSGIYYNESYGREVVGASTSPTMNIWYHDGSGDWAYVQRDTIETTGYDDGTGTSTVTANQYYRSTWVIVDNQVHWQYPTTGYVTVAGCVAGVDPTISTGIADHPKSTSVCLKGNATAFPAAGSDQWIDARPLPSNIYGAIVSDHGNLAGLGDDDHTIYHLTDGTRAMTGALTVNSTATNTLDFLQTEGLSVGNWMTMPNFRATSTTATSTIAFGLDITNGLNVGGLHIDSSGNVMDGAWEGDTVAIAYGGTNQTSFTNWQPLSFDGTSLISTTTLYTNIGGTGVTSWTAGDIIYASDATTLTPLGKGASSTILTTNGTIPAWTDSPAFTALRVSGNILISGAASDLIIPDEIQHLGDIHTKIEFGLDRMNFDAGGLEFFEINEDVDRMHVNDDGVDIDFRIEGVDDDVLFSTNATLNNVGIGTSSPYAKLSVVGGIVMEYFNATSTVASSTIAFGLQADTLDIQSTSATSTFGNGLRIETGGVSLDQLISCTTALETDANGNIYCGTDPAGGAVNNLDDLEDVTLTGTSTGDIIYIPSTGQKWVNFGIGASSTVLTVDASSDIFWTTQPSFASLVISGSATSTNAGNMDIAGELQVGTLFINSSGQIEDGTWQGDTIVEAYGGTNQSSYTEGDILVSDTANSLAVLPISATSSILSSDGTDVKWITKRKLTDSFTYVIATSTMSTSTSVYAFPEKPYEYTITKIKCSGNTSTTTIQLDERSGGDIHTAGTDVGSQPIFCGWESETSSTTPFDNAVIAAEAPLNLQIVDAEPFGGPSTSLSATVYYTYEE